MTIFLLSLAGFPLTGGFIGKVFIIRAAVERHLVPLAVVLVLTSLLSYYYYLRVVWFMWFREPDAGGRATPMVTPALKVALVITAVGVILLGVVPGQLLDAAQDSAAGLMAAPAPTASAPAPIVGSVQ
jgi:NADH-quinone oxidoreductase subunit N